jgi:hypothetical protein
MHRRPISFLGIPSPRVRGILQDLDAWPAFCAQAHRHMHPDAILQLHILARPLAKAATYNMWVCML